MSPRKRAHYTKPLAEHREHIEAGIGRKAWSTIRFHFSSVHNKSLACPFRSSYSVNNCPYACHEGPCVFDHSRYAYEYKEVFDINKWNECGYIHPAGIELKKMIDSKTKLINNRGNIAMQCNHHYIIDYIDITPDKGQNIKFCTKCFKTCN